MRAQAMEKLLRKMTTWVNADVDDDHRMVVLKNLATKAEILTDREDNRAASVIRELMNGD